MRTWRTASRTATASATATLSGSAVLVLLASVWLLAAAPGCDNSGGTKGGKDGSASSSSSSGSGEGGSGGSASGGVAVVDLDKVAKEMGWTEQIEKSLQSAGKSLNQQLADHVEQLREAINTK